MEFKKKIGGLNIAYSKMPENPSGEVDAEEVKKILETDMNDFLKVVAYVWITKKIIDMTIGEIKGIDCSPVHELGHEIASHSVGRSEAASKALGIETPLNDIVQEFVKKHMPDVFKDGTWH